MDLSSSIISFLSKTRQAKNKDTENIKNILPAIRENIPVLFTNAPNLSDLHIPSIEITKCPRLIERLPIQQNFIITSLLKDNLISLNLLGSLNNSPLLPGIISALGSNTSLKRLILTSNAIEKQACQSLAKAIIGHPSLTDVQIEGISLGDDGAEILANVLLCNTPIRVLFLGGNEIGIAGAQAIASTLKDNKSLTMLNLRNNLIGPDGAAAFASALEKNITLTSLDISNNEINNEDVESTIRTSLQRNKNLLQSNKPSLS